MKTNLKRALSLVCALALCIGMLPMSALAADEPDPSDPDSYVQNGASVTQDGVTVSKTAEKVTGSSGNQYDITLSVTVPDDVDVPGQDTDVVLVIDASTSMAGGNISAAKTAAQSFARALLADTVQADVRLAVVTYTSTPTTECELTDRLRSVNSAIDAIRIRKDQGTNIQAGIYQARTILEGSVAANKVIVLLSDGEPTYSYRSKGTGSYTHGQRGGDRYLIPESVVITGFDYDEVIGSGSDYSLTYSETIIGFPSYHGETSVEATCTCGESHTHTFDDYEYYKNNGDPAIDEADFAKDAGYTIYSLYLGNPNDNAQHTMSGIATDSDHYQQADNDSLSGLLEQIAGDVISTTAGAVTDPMGEYIDFVGFVDETGDHLGNIEGVSVNTETDTLTWTPNEAQATETEGGTTYTITYRIEIDTTAEGFREGWVDANGTTTFTYSVDGNLKTVKFNVPEVWGEMPTRESEVYVKVYLDNQDVTSAWENYLGSLTTTGTTTADGEAAYDSDTECIVVPYAYDEIDSADVKFTLSNTDNVVLQGIDGTFVYGKDGWKGVKENGSHVWTADNVAGETTLKIYLNTPYTVKYYVDGDLSSDIVDTRTYITVEGVSTASEPDFDGITDSSSVEERSEGEPGSWKNTGCNTTVDLEELPEDTAETVYDGWFTTDDGSAEHSESYTGEGIQTAAANSGNGTPTVIECYATSGAATGTLTVTKTVEGLDALPVGFTITVTSDKLTDDIVMTDDEATRGENNTYTWTINNLTPGTYTVTESGYVVEGYNVEASESVTAEVTAGETVPAILTNTYEAQAPELTVTKTVVKVGGAEVEEGDQIPEAEVGDTIIYKIDVTNTGNVPLTNVTVTDRLNDTIDLALYTDEACETEAAFPIASLNEDATATFYAKYKVAVAGESLSNVATASVPDGPEDENEPVIVDVKNQYIIEYTVINGTASGTGFTGQTSGTITVNEGDEVLLDFTANEGFALDTVTVDGTATKFNTEESGYKFEDVDTNHKIVVVYAEDKIGPDDKPDGIPDKYQVTVVYATTKGGSVNPTGPEVLTIYADDGVTYAETGDVTAKGSTAAPDADYFFTKWTVAVDENEPADALIYGSTTGPIILSTAYGGQVYTFTAHFEKKTYGLETVKTLISVGETQITESTTEIPMAKVGEQIVWEVTVTNTGNQPLPNVTVSDLMINASGAASLTSDTADVTFNGTTATIPTLDVGQTVTITATYTVQPEDAGKELNNRALVSVDGKTDDDVTPEDPVTVEDKGLEITKTADKTTANRGDTITYTITVKNTGNVALNGVTVSDKMMVGSATVITGEIALPDVGVDGSYEIGTLDVGQTVSIIYTHEVTAEDVAAEEIKNVATVSSPDLPDDKEPEDEVTIPTHDYTVTITPADITVYTGGEVYGNIVDEDGVEITENTSGLPEPGYYLVLSDDVREWLTEQYKNDEADEGDEHAGAKNLADILSFRYYDMVGETMLRDWGLVYQGVYSRDENGNVTQYVYSLTPNRSSVDTGTEVRLEFTDDGNIVSNDTIYMNQDTVSEKYEMTIHDGGLEQSDIVAELTTGEGDAEKAITCNVEIGTGNLIVRSVVNQANNTNEIAASETAVDNNVITAVDNDSVTYYVNNSEVEIPVEENADRVQLLVDEVSNSDTFNAAMGEDAIDHISDSLSKATYELAYLDLVDTENGNAVVTMGTNEDGTNQSLTIYWPVPDNAASNSDFHIVHYTGMDRQTVMGEDDLSSAAKATPEVKIVTIGNQRYVTFTTDSFSPFVLVYEEEDNTDPDPGRPSRPSHRPDRDDEPEDLNTEDHVGYLIGFTDGTIRPEDDISRAEVATIFFRLLTDEARETYWSQTNSYSDVAPDAWYNNAVSTLSNMGILDGYLDGTFRPNAPITRSEFTKIAVSFFDYAAEEYSYEGWFSDVQGREWFVEYLTAAIEYGLIEGMPDGTFRPLDNITRAEAATIVNRTLGREPHEDYLLSRREMITWPDNSASAWYYADMQEATNSHDYAWIVINEDEDDEMEVEEWTDKLDERDWAELEQTWSDAYDAPGGEVMD